MESLDDLSSLSLPVISGASGGADGTSEDNAIHVLILGDEVTLQGLRVRAGRADGELRDGLGGGALAWGARGLYIDHVWFEDNFATHGGGIAFGDMPEGDSSSVIQDSVFFANQAAHSGGAVVARVGQLSFSMAFRRVLFVENNAALDRGGAVNVDYGFDATFTDCLFEGNEALASSGGAVYLDDNASQFPGTLLSFVDSDFIDNHAAVRGGAIEAYNSMTWLHLSRVSMSANYDGEGENDVYLGYRATLCGAEQLAGVLVEQAESATVKTQVASALDCEGGQQQGPPEAAYTACEGASQGDACSFEDGGEARQGICGEIPGESRLVCGPG